MYDALVSVNVPTDKARAVVDAMEQDMGTTPATKQDLELLQLATRQDLEKVRLATKQDVDLLRQAMDGRFALVDQKLENLELKLFLKLGSLIAAGVALTLGALRLWI